MFARRPGTFAAVFEPTTGLVVRRFDTPPERHFYGHGVFDPTGRVLVATENDTSRGQGVLGLYDAADGYRRIGELPAHGIGPHDIALLPDGRTLAVANGGILTLPESGRDKLNLDSMRPSLNRIELASGRLLDEGRLPDRLHRLSIRHLAQAEGGLIAAGLQWEGEPGDLVPLVAIDRGDGLATLDAPADVLATMAAYIGSVAFDRSGAVLGASCPRGNRIAFWRVADGGVPAHGRDRGRLRARPGPCARPVPHRERHRCGDRDRRRSAGRSRRLGERAPVAYDNHLTLI